MVERYIEWAGFTFTHLRPQDFMQNLLSYGDKKGVGDGVIHAYVNDANLSWVDVDDVALVAALALADPDNHSSKTYRLSSGAKTFDEIAALMTQIASNPIDTSLCQLKCSYRICKTLMLR